jgi:hypothetical protein
MPLHATKREEMAMIGSVTLKTVTPALPADSNNPLASMVADRSTTQRASGTRIAPRTIASSEGENYTSRSLNAGERQVAEKALRDSRGLLDRTESSLRENWNERVPGSKLTNKQLFKQYFGDNTEGMRAEVLGRVQRIRDKVDIALSQNIGNTVVRATGAKSDYTAYVNPVSGKISLGDRFFNYRSPNPLSPNSQAGAFVHEISHTVQYNGRKSTDAVPGYARGDKRVYNEDVLRELANSNPSLAVANSNLLMWYVSRPK